MAERLNYLDHSRIYRVFPISISNCLWLLGNIKWIFVLSLSLSLSLSLFNKPMTSFSVCHSDHLPLSVIQMQKPSGFLGVKLGPYHINFFFTLVFACYISAKIIQVMYVCIYPTPPSRSGCVSRWIFKLS